MVFHGCEAFRDFVNPTLALRAELGGEPTRLVSAEGCCLMDEEGRVYLDFLAGWGTQAFGHRSPQVEAALRGFLDGSEPNLTPSRVGPAAGRLAEALHLRTGYDRTFLANGGTEAVEAALKLARAATGRPRLACLEGAYHGCTYGSLAMMAEGPYKEGFGPHLPEVIALPFGDAETLRRALADPALAAVVVEPIQVEGGMRALPSEFLDVLCAGTSPEGPLLVADEVQTGLGRTGAFLASGQWPRRPDVVVLGKALGGGAMPLSALLTRGPIFDRAYGTLARCELHASTFGGNALAATAGLATVTALDEALLKEVRAKGRTFHEALDRHVAPSPLVQDIRGEGLLWGVELRAPDHPVFRFDYLGLPELGDVDASGFLALRALLRRRFLAHVCGHAWQVLRLHPPLTVEPGDLEAFAEALGDVLTELEGMA